VAGEPLLPLALQGTGRPLAVLAQSGGLELLNRLHDAFSVPVVPIDAPMEAPPPAHLGYWGGLRPTHSGQHVKSQPVGKPITSGSDQERHISFRKFMACSHRWPLACADGRIVADHIWLQTGAPHFLRQVYGLLPPLASRMR
jgi:hypothetical protein